MKKQIVIIAGPTAVGKTEVAIEVAKKIKGEIISADSMQIYKYMNIGTAKPSQEEQRGIPHYLIDVIDPREDFSVAEFQRRAKVEIDNIIGKKKVPIVAGGTGLYINSLLYDMDFTETVSNWGLRKALEEEARLYGNEYVHNKLKSIDPEAAQRIHPNNVKRVIRAIEVKNESGDSIGNFNRDITYNEDYDCVLIGLLREREELYQRINLRVDLMIEEGLIEEVKKLISMGYPKDLIAFKGIGYKEIIAYLEGQYSLEEAIHILKRDTRRYAKRQLTWFKRYDQMKWYNLSNYNCKKNLIQDIISHIEGHLHVV